MHIPNLPVKLLSGSSGTSGLFVAGLLAALVMLANRKASQPAKS